MNNFLLKLCLFEIFLKLLYLKQEKINSAPFISLEDDNDSSEAKKINYFGHLKFSDMEPVLPIVDFMKVIQNIYLI